jgi:hypothetical protein
MGLLMSEGSMHFSISQRILSIWGSHSGGYEDSVFWDITTCSPLEVSRSACDLLHAGFVLGLVFDTEDGGDVFLRNVDWLIYPEDKNPSNPFDFSCSVPFCWLCVHLFTPPNTSYQGYGTKWSWPSSKHRHLLVSVNRGRLKGALIRIADLLADMWTPDLWNKNQHY